MSTPDLVDPGSFRDPSGFVFRRAGVVYRQVNQRGAEHLAALESSGLRAELVKAGLLLDYEAVDEPPAAPTTAHRVLRPRQLEQVSYPYEWCFSQLRDFALATLEIAERALARDLVLKDASAYNLQLVDGSPALIDTLSFEHYREGTPWVAYRQFCQHFLAPLALMARVDVRLGQLLRLHIDGVPLDLASRLLPKGTRWSPSLGIHLHAHARSQARHQGAAAETTGSAPPQRARGFSRQAFRGLLASLRSAVEKQQWRGGDTEWADYYAANNNYGAAGLEEKADALRGLLAPLQPRRVWDLGANTGRFSAVARALGATVWAWDIDPSAVELGYRRVRAERDGRLHPLLLDLTNPSPSLGWANAERASFTARANADVVLALGLVHHLAISNNVPLARIAEHFAALSPHLILEWVPKEDSQVQKLLRTREDLFPAYDAAGFEAAFAHTHEIAERVPVRGTARTLYRLMRR